MSYKLEQHGNQRIIVGVVGADFDLRVDTEPYLHEIQVMLDRMDGPTVYISDLRGFELNFGDLTALMSVVTRGDTAVLKHPNLRNIILVASSNMIKLGVSALGQTQYGGLHASVVPTLEEALAAAEEDLTPTA